MRMCLAEGLQLCFGAVCVPANISVAFDLVKSPPGTWFMCKIRMRHLLCCMHTRQSEGPLASLANASAAEGAHWMNCLRKLPARNVVEICLADASKPEIGSTLSMSTRHRFATCEKYGNQTWHWNIGFLESSRAVAGISAVVSEVKMATLRVG
jgi:hypothetical protein